MLLRCGGCDTVTDRNVSNNELQSRLGDRPCQMQATHVEHVATTASASAAVTVSTAGRSFDNSLSKETPIAKQAPAWSMRLQCSMITLAAVSTSRAAVAVR